MASWRPTGTPDAIKAMRKDLKTGTGIIAGYKKAKSFAPWTFNANEQQPMSEDQGADDAEARYLAARALMRAGDDAGYEFAAKFSRQTQRAPWGLGLPTRPHSRSGRDRR